MYKYSDYLTMPKALSFEEMRGIHEELLDEVGDDADALELYDMLKSACIQYGQIRQEWPSLSRDAKSERDKTRTAAHDSVIFHFNVLIRYLHTVGKAAAWADKLGDADSDRIYRKTYGDFACYIAFVEGICAR